MYQYLQSMNLTPLHDYEKLLINLELLPYCNFKCPYCYEHKKVKFGHIITLNEIKLINKALLKARYNIDLFLMGGEPLYYNNLINAINIFETNHKIKNINIYTNASKSLDYLFDKNLYFILSYHPSQNNENFLNNVKLLLKNNERFEVNLLMHYKYKTKLIEIDNILNKLNVNVKPTYLYIPTSEYKQNTKMFNTQKAFLKCENIKEFIFNNDEISKNHLLYNKLNSFKNWYCRPCRICINNIGNICIGCGPAKDNIFKNNNFLDSFYIQNIKCENDYCVKDMFLIQRKENDIL